nr:MAG TPA: Minor capsid protein [Caudoviricetes sp.]
MMIKGITVILCEQTQTGIDAFNRPIYTETEVEVENVLVAPSSTDDITTSIDLAGKKAVYTLAIPKGDEHEWENKKIKFFGHTWKSFGFTIQGIEENIPLSWNKKVMVERYE